MNKFNCWLLVLLMSTQAFAQSIEDDTLSAADLEQMMFMNQLYDSINNSFNYQRGKVEIGGGIAQINVPAGFKYIGPEDAKRVLEELWENPPQEEPYLGMLFPEDGGPLGSWGIDIGYDESGYIEDDDAADIDYEELLEEMQSDASEVNEARRAQNYPTIELIGWASTPYYDAATHKLHWAQEFSFEGNESNTLNYKIRILGRKGFLQLNAIADINDLEDVKSRIGAVLEAVEFTEGNQYDDFDSNIDEVAAYGIAGLVAGKVLAKAGFFAVIAKSWKLIALGIAGAFAAARKFFGGKES